MLEIVLDRWLWQRPVSRRKGFAWETAGEDVQLARVPGAALKEYRPGAGLFRTFAGLEKTPESILRFANRYGTLRERLEFCPLSFWREQVERMRQAVALQDALDDGDWNKVRENLEPFHAFDTEGTRTIRKKLAAGISLSREELVNAAVMRLCFPAVQALRNLEPEGFWDARKGIAGLRLKHPDLLGFLWFQFAHVLVARLHFKPCRACGDWFQVDPKVNRADRSTCSDSCRFRLYKQRQRQALDLHARGWAVKRIAKELGADVSKIKRWLSEE